MVDIGELQKKLKIIADVVNSFKSEAVQLRVVDALIGQLGAPIALTSGQRDGHIRNTKAITAAKCEIQYCATQSKGWRLAQFAWCLHYDY